MLKFTIKYNPFFYIQLPSQWLYHMQSIFANREVDGTVRWMAITYLKNGVDQFWRRGAPLLVHQTNTYVG